MKEERKGLKKKKERENQKRKKAFPRREGYPINATEKV